MAETTTCAIAGGGPAGMVLGLLLARAGVDVTVLEKHADFLRDFRGDTVHPVTMRLLDELGLGPAFDALPKSIVQAASMEVAGHVLTFADFGRLRQPHPYIAMVPQWDLLDLLADAAKTEPNFTLRMNTEVIGLRRDGGGVTGVRFRGPDGDGELRADLTVGCDGRTSAVRREAGLIPREFPVPFDVWWFRLPRDGDAGVQLFPQGARPVIRIPRQGYLQTAYLIPKGGDQRLRARGLDTFRRELSEVVPPSSADTLTSWDDVKVLDVRLNRLSRWHQPGLLCIGDAAHAMSPAGGVGINLAIADAVATARLLAQPLARRTLTPDDLAAVRARRRMPTVITQLVQRALHRAVIGPMVRGAAAPLSPRQASVIAAILRRVPALSAVPAYVVGVGLFPEHAPDFARRPFS